MKLAVPILLAILIVSPVPSDAELDESIVAHYTMGSQVSIASTNGDAFLLAYETYDNVDYSQIWTLLVDKSGTPIRGSRVGGQRCHFPSVSTLGNGTYIVTFHYIGSSSGIPQIFARSYDEEGNSTSGILHLVNGGVKHGCSPGSAGGPDDTFTTVWIMADNTVIAREFDEFGFPVSEGWRVDDGIGTPGRKVAMARAGSGMSSYAWYSEEISGTVVRMRIFDAQGDPVTASIPVADWRGSSIGPDENRKHTIVMADDGSVVVAWGERNGRGVWYTRYTLEGVRIASPQLVAGDGRAPLLAMDRTGRFAVGATGDVAVVTFHDRLGNPIGAPLAPGASISYASGGSGQMVLLDDGSFGVSMLEWSAPWPAGIYFGYGELDVSRDELFLAEMAPQTLNLGSNGRWVTVCLSSVEFADVDEIDSASLLLEGVAANSAEIEDNALVAKFPRQDVGAQLAIGMEVPVTLTGQLLDGTAFTATDTIRVIDPSRASKAKTKSVYPAGATASVEWRAIYGDTDTKYDGYISTDGGLSWEPLFAGLRGTNTYSWKLAADLVGNAEILVEAKASQGVFHAMTQRFTVDGVAVEAAEPSATEYSVSASPNPFNPQTTLFYALPVAGRAELVVYDLAGRRVKTLVSGYVDAGPHEAQWDGRDEQGRRVASGVYLYRLVAGEFVETKRMVLLK